MAGYPFMEYHGICCNLPNFRGTSSVPLTPSSRQPSEDRGRLKKRWNKNGGSGNVHGVCIPYGNLTQRWKMMNLAHYT